MIHGKLLYFDEETKKTKAFDFKNNRVLEDFNFEIVDYTTDHENSP